MGLRPAIAPDSVRRQHCVLDDIGPMCANSRMTDATLTTEKNEDAGAPEPRAWHHRNLCWRVIHVLFFLFCRSWIRLRATGQENIDNTRGGLFLINHQSFLDPLLVAVLLSRPVSYLARDSLFKVPLVGWILKSTYVIPISREAARGGSIRVAMERLDSGFLVGIFPEGTRSLTDEVRSFRPGFLALARRSRQPIYPVGIAGANRAMPKGAWWIRPVRIEVVYGAPLDAHELSRLQDDKDDAALAEMARFRVAECASKAERLLKS